MKLLNRIDSFISKIETCGLVFSIIFMIGVTVLQIILRQFFETGIMWADETLRHMVLWVGFIGASLATRSEHHIRMDILARHVSERGKNIIHIIGSLAAAVVCGVLVFASYQFIVDEYMRKSVLGIGVSTWVAQLIIPFGFLMMSFRFLLSAVKRISL